MITDEYLNYNTTYWQKIDIAIENVSIGGARKHLQYMISLKSFINLNIAKKTVISSKYFSYNIIHLRINVAHSHKYDIQRSTPQFLTSTLIFNITS